MFQEPIKTWFAAHEEEFLADLARLVSVESVKGAATAEQPYGPGPAAALAEALSIAERWGLRGENWENRLGIVELAGAGETDDRKLDVLAHLDVVPADPARWKKTAPFVMKREGERLYGRGVTDDKGPALAVLYALRAVRDLGLAKGGVRLVLGCDEENGSSELPYYYGRTKEAEMTLTPDAGWPVINTEKGILVGTLTAAVPAGRIKAIKGGSAYNAVPAECEAVLRDGEGERSLRTEGVPAHASMPDKGENAVTEMVALLAAEEGLSEEEAALFGALARLFPHGDWRGESLGIAMADDATGPLTISLDVIRFEEGVLTAQFDARLPYGFGDAEIRRLEEVFGEAGLAFTHGEAMPHHVPADTAFIRTLLETYEAYTGKEGYCYGIGGLTYCHHVKNGVAFGVEEPGSDHHIHGDDEYAELGELMLTGEIYAEAIARLTA